VAARGAHLRGGHDARTLQEALTTTFSGLKVIVAEGECQLERQRRIKPWTAGRLKRGERVERVKYGVDEDVCTGDHACIRLSGCPTLTLKDNPDPLRVDPVATVIDGCVGCGLCGANAHAATLCPSFYRAEVVTNPGLARTAAGRACADDHRLAAAGLIDPTLNRRRHPMKLHPPHRLGPGPRPPPGDPAAFAQAFPNKPVKLIVNFPPGGAADVIGRALAQQLGDQLKQQVVVENRPGANGNIGADAVAKSPADGHTLLMSSGGAMTVNPFLYTKMPFDAEKDLVPVASAARVLVFLMTHPSVPVNSVAGVRRLRQGQPGQAELRLGRQRQQPAPGRRDVQAPGRLRGHARALQGRRAGADRPAGRPGAVHVRPRPRPAPREGRQAQAAGGGQPEAQRAGARHADAGRGWA
jgi:ferredoxin